MASEYVGPGTYFKMGTTRHAEENVTFIGLIEKDEETYENGKNQYYFPGQIVVWCGSEPAIFRVKALSVHQSEDTKFYSSHISEYSNCSTRNLRPAFKAEIKHLGKDKIVLLNSGKRY